MKPFRTTNSLPDLDPPTAPAGGLDLSCTNTDTDAIVDHLLRQAGPMQHPELVREILVTALKAGRECDSRVDLKLMTSTLKEMRFTAKVFGAYRGVRKITVFGSARTRSDHPAYSMAVDLGSSLAKEGYMVITGGGPGIMQAVNEGAGAEHSFGVRIRLPFEAGANHVLENNPRLINYKYFFNRKVAFIKEADAVVLFPGGFGTLDEAMETLTLVQTGKRYPLPLILIEPRGGTYWSSKVDFMKRELLSLGYIDAADLDLFQMVHTPGEAVQAIQRFYSRYHSMRFVGETLVMRLSRPLDARAINGLQTGFVDLLKPGGRIVASAALPEEADEPGLLELPRLLVDFNRKDFGRLRLLIDAINH
jgi:uncharacterized protein (TIGR00730 family)